MIDRNAYTPLYIQFHDLLRDELVDYPIGSNIPPERTLCDKYSLDRITVRKALALLAEEGYIERKQGRGTRVVRHIQQCSDRVLFLLSQDVCMVDRLGEPFYARSIDALEDRLRKMNKHLLYSKILSNDSISDLCKSLDAQAIILAGTANSSMIEQCRAQKIPLVGYNTYIPDFPSVMVDNDGGAATSAQYLLNLGHRSIGFIHVPGYVNSEKRLSRFKIEMRNAGLDESALVIAKGNWSEESGYRAAHELLGNANSRVTAIFGGNDSMAIGAMRAAQEIGLRIPADLSIIGFDGIAQSAFTTPALTTSQVDVAAMAESACMLLNHIMTYGMLRNVHAMVSTEFIIRDSTGKLTNK